MPSAMADGFTGGRSRIKMSVNFNGQLRDAGNEIINVDDVFEGSIAKMRATWNGFISVGVAFDG